MRERVLIGLCLPSGSQSVELTDWIGALVRAAEDASFPWEFAVDHVARTTPVAYAENLMVGKFLAGDCDRLWLIPEDMEPHRASHRVLELDADVALSWTYILERDPETPLAARLVPNFFRAEDETGSGFRPVEFAPDSPVPFAVDAGGMHSCVIRRRVFCPEMELPRQWVDALGRPRYLSEDDAGFAVPYFRTEYRPDGRVGRTDDFDFCWRAKQAGFTVAGHPGAPSGHVKTADVSAFGLMAAKLMREAVR